MARRYFSNFRLELAYGYFFNNLSAEENKKIHDALDITSGDNLPKSQMVSGPYPVYGGGGETDETHAFFNVDYETIGIGRVGARCGCIFIIKKNSWVTDNALLVSKFDERLLLRFVRHFLSFMNLGQFANNAMQPVISKTRISEIKIPILDWEKQKSIADILDKIEQNVSIAELNHNGLYSNVRVVDHWENLCTEIQIQKSLLTQLKQSILQEAIQGKLTEDWRKQHPDMEPASELLKRIKAEKAKLIKDGEIKKGKPLPSIDSQEIPFELPEGWVWCRLGDITNYGSSEKAEPNKLSDDTWVLDLEDIEKESSIIIQRKTLKERSSLSTKSVFKKGWILYSKLRPYLDKIVLADEDGVCTTEILPLRVFNEMVPKFMMFGMKGRHFLNYVNSKVGGMKMPRLGTEDGKMAIIPIAPTEEQKVIVQKVETLMEKCRALEAEITQSEQHAQMLMQAVLKEAFEPKKGDAIGVKTNYKIEEEINVAAEPGVGIKTIK